MLPARSSITHTHTTSEAGMGELGSRNPKHEQAVAYFQNGTIPKHAACNVPPAWTVRHLLQPRRFSSTSSAQQPR